MPEDEPSQVSNPAAARGAKEGGMVVSTVNDAGVGSLNGGVAESWMAESLGGQEHHGLR